MPDRRRSWPYEGQARSPRALTQTPDGLLNSDRSLAGPLRWGTAPGAGPRVGTASVDGASASDFGIDRVSQRSHDPIGRVPYDAESTLIARRR